MALNAAGEGPYGFSFELRRTTSETLDTFLATVTGAAVARAGRRAVVETPATLRPRSCVNRRRDRGCADGCMITSWEARWRVRGRRDGPAPPPPSGRTSPPRDAG